MSKSATQSSNNFTFISMILWIASAVLAMVGGLLLAVGGSIAEFSGVTTVEGESSAALAVTGVVVVILNVIVIALAVRMRRGGQAARVILTVLGIVTLLSLWVGSTGAGFPLIQTLVTGAAVVLMWLSGKEQSPQA